MEFLVRNLDFSQLLLKPLALLALPIYLLAAACTTLAPVDTREDAPTTQAGAATDEVSRQNTLIFATNLSDMLALDPATVYEYSGGQVIGAVYETLVGFEPDQPGIHPRLAESWQIEEGDELWTLTFVLNPAATFASGNPVRAADVVYSWGRALDINKTPAYLFTGIAQLTKENIRAVDDHTLEVKLPKTVSPQVFLSILAFPMTAVVDQAALAPHLGSDFGESWLNDNSVGSGPYLLESWERNARVTLIANPNYWGDAPAMQRVIMQNVTEVANLQAMLETGDADIVQDLGPEQVAALEGNPDVQLVRANTIFFVYTTMNTRVPPFDNPDVREAIRYAINYDDFAMLLAGNGTVMQEIIPAGFLGHTGKRYFTQDLDKAKELMAKAGIAAGTEIDFTVPIGVAPGGLEFSVIAAKIQSDLAQIGLVLNIQQLQVSEVIQLFRAGEGQMIQLYWGPDFSDPDAYVTPFTDYATQSVAWRTGWDQPEIAALGKQAALELDNTRRAELYAEVVERVAHESPYLVLYQPMRVFGIRSNLTGFYFNPLDTTGLSFAILGKE